MARRPAGEHALSGAERQARYRLRLGAATTIGATTAATTVARQAAPARPPPRPLPRPQRWSAAVAELVALQSEYADWLEALPEATRDGATGDALQAVIDLDLEPIQAIVPPRGFGRD
jgi:hypothetical protein